MLKRIIPVAVAMCMALPLAAHAADYPNGPVTIVVPSKAGGSTDATARLFIIAAKKFWPDAEFVVKNVGGSGGQKGFEEIADAKPDGQTIGMVFTTQVVAHVVSKRARYTLDSFHVMGNLNDDPEIVVVPQDSAINVITSYSIHYTKLYEECLLSGNEEVFCRIRRVPCDSNCNEM